MTGATPASSVDPSSEALDALDPNVHQLLREGREALGMQIAFVSRFVDDRRVIEAVDANCPVPFGPGDSDASEATYCQRIVDGRLPQAIPDTSLNPVAAALPVTTELEVGAHLGVPIVLADGSVYGTLCAYCDRPRPVDDRDSAILVLVARSIAQYLSRERSGQGDHAAVRRRIAELINGGLLSSVYQPIIDLATGDVVAVEGLARFPQSFGRRTDEWFSDAVRVGQAATLELAAVERAADAFDELPVEVALSVNVSADVVVTEPFGQWLAHAPVDRLIVELTEHDRVDDYTAILDMLAPARSHGLRLAVDDAGAGYASMRHTLLLKPDILKLDISLVRDVDSNRDKRALCRAITTFAGALGTKVVAEGVETAAELVATRGLGVDYVQGYHLARPTPLEDLRFTGYRTGRVRRAAPTVRPETDLMIHEMTLAGASSATIAARLNSLGERTPRGIRWHATSVDAAYELCSLRGTTV